MNGKDVLLLLVACVFSGMLLVVLLMRWLTRRSGEWLDGWQSSVDGEVAFLTVVSVVLAAFVAGPLVATLWV